MKKLLLVLVGLVVVVIAAAVIVPFLLPTDTYKRQIEAQVERTTGRKLTIDGALDFSLLPTAAVNVEHVRFANLEGGAEPDMVRLKGLEAELKIWPLLSGSVEVARFVLIEPEFHLEIDADGTPNWALGSGAPDESAAEPPPQEEGAAGTEATPEAGGGMSLPVSDVRLGDIRIQDGTLTFFDARSGTEERIEAINVDLDLPDLRSRLEANGSLAYKGQTIDLALAVERPLDLLQGGSSPVRLEGKAPDLALTFDGALDAAAPGASGAMQLDVASIRDLAAWLAEPIAFEGEGLQTLRITGQLEGSPAHVAFNDAELALDAIEGQGNVAIDLSGAVPRLTGRLDLGAVDLNPYLAPEPPDQTPSEPGESAERTGSAGAAAGGWSDDPIELPPIGGIEVDFQLAVDSLKVNEVQLDRSVLAVRLEDQRLRADLEEMALYGGQGSGRLDVEVADGAPAIRQRFRLRKLNARPFLTDAAGFERLEGTVNAELALETRGRSQRELVENLNGDGEATFRNGAIVGINLAGMVRNVASALQGGVGGEERKTDFAKLSGTFKINNGILTNDDLWLQAPVLRVAGSGTLDLPQRTVDYRIEPKAAKTLEGQGGEREVAGLLVPVIVRGPWDDPTFTPDLSGVVQRALEDPEALRDEVEQQIDQLGDVGDDVRDAIKEGNPEDALRGLLGRGGGGGGGGGDRGEDRGQSGGDAAGKLLKGLFGN